VPADPEAATKAASRNSGRAASSASKTPAIAGLVHA
jgi:hypothetical protein